MSVSEPWRTRGVRAEASATDLCGCGHRYGSHDVARPGGPYCETCRRMARPGWYHSVTLAAPESVPMSTQEKHQEGR